MKGTWGKCRNRLPSGTLPSDPVRMPRSFYKLNFITGRLKSVNTARHTFDTCYCFLFLVPRESFYKSLCIPWASKTLSLSCICFSNPLILPNKHLLFPWYPLVHPSYIETGVSEIPKCDFSLPCDALLLLIDKSVSLQVLFNTDQLGKFQRKLPLPLDKNV